MTEELKWKKLGVVATLKVVKTAGKLYLSIPKALSTSLGLEWGNWVQVELQKKEVK